MMNMKKHRTVYMVIMVFVVLLTLYMNISVNAEKDNGKSIFTSSEQEILAQQADPQALFVTPNDSAIQSGSTIIFQQGVFLGRTLFVIAVLVILWFLCIYWATRLGIFLGRNEKGGKKS
jgi:hypothetical protein